MTATAMPKRGARPYSQSRLSLWMACPRSLKYRLDETPQTEADIIIIGSMAHAVYEAYANHCLRENIQTDISEIERIAWDTMQAQCAKRAERGQRNISYDQMETLYRTLVEQWAADRIFDPNTIAGVEERIAIDESCNVVEWDSPDAWFRGILDLYEYDTTENGESRIRITDYKTGWNVAVPELQMEIYAWLVMSAYRPDVVECVLDFTRFNKQSVSRFTQDDFGRIDQQVRRITAAIEADTEYSPTPGPACLYCSYAGTCDCRVVAPNVIVTREDAEQTVQAMSCLERDLKLAKDRLREYVDMNGPVAAGGVEWGYHSQSGENCDARAFRDTLDGTPVDAWDYLRVDKVKLKKLKKRGEWQHGLGEIMEPTVTVKFTSKKTGAEDDE